MARLNERMEEQVLVEAGREFQREMAEGTKEKRLAEIRGMHATYLLQNRSVKHKTTTMRMSAIAAATARYTTDCLGLHNNKRTRVILNHKHAPT